MKFSIEWNFINDKSYIKQTKTLNYYNVNTRSDITYTIEKFCEINKKSSNDYLQLLKYLFRYIKKTIHFNLMYEEKFFMNNLKLHAYNDVAHEDNLSFKRSINDYVIFMIEISLLWKIKKQSIVIISFTKIEFINLSFTKQILMWINNMLKNLNEDINQKKSLILYINFQNARINAFLSQNNQKTRNIDIRFKWIIGRIKNENFSLIHVNSKKMIIDDLTKILNKDLHDQFLHDLGMKSTLEWWKFW